jgi:hypothetical protein
LVVANAALVVAKATAADSVTAKTATTCGTAAKKSHWFAHAALTVGPAVINFHGLLHRYRRPADADAISVCDAWTIAIYHSMAPLVLVWALITFRMGWRQVVYGMLYSVLSNWYMLTVLDEHALPTGQLAVMHRLHHLATLVTVAFSILAAATERANQRKFLAAKRRAALEQKLVVAEMERAAYRQVIMPLFRFAVASH